MAPDAMGDCRGFGQAFSLSETQPQPFSAGSAGAQKAGDTVAVLERAIARVRPPGRARARRCIRMYHFVGGTATGERRAIVAPRCGARDGALEGSC